MKERPILFSAPMVRAILEGRKIVSAKKVFVKKSQDHNSRHHYYNRLVNGLLLNQDTQCWEWNRHITNKGYGKLTINGRGKYTHRLSYELFKGLIPEELHVLHKCDNPKCANPDHLFLGTRSDNMKDCYRKGRSKISPVSFKGENNPMSKLKECDVLQIKRLLEKKTTQREIAKKFCVSQSLISGIKLGKTWA